MIHTDKPAFRRFDYGSGDLNFAHYNQTTAPDYDLSKLDFPVAIMNGKYDLLADPADVAWTASQIKKDRLIF